MPVFPAIVLAVALPPDPQVLADRIDRRLAAAWGSDVRPAPPADDAEFLRRAHLDLAGRIPRPRQVYDFLADPSPDKRDRLVDDLLESPRSAAHLAAVWRAFLLPEAAAVPEARFFRPGFEAWLRDRFRAAAPYDRTVRELLAAPVSADRRSPDPVLRDPAAANPLALIAAKDAKPENLAAAATRAFLGVQLECAQCHDHPFADWTQDQFWQTAAFFAGVERHGPNVFAPVSDDPTRRHIAVPNTKRTVSARFLDGGEPAAGSRAELARWLTDRSNRQFARATANRVWAVMFGVGLVDPPDDFHDDNPPSHPELLDDLADALVESGFDLRHLFRAVGRTEAYRRTSRQTEPSQADPRRYLRGPLKGLTGEQLFDSLVAATGCREPAADRDGFDARPNAPRQRFLTRFAAAGKPTEPPTSVAQALALMNGRFVADMTTAGRSPSLVAVRDTPGLSTADRVEALYVLTLSRKPTPAEASRLIEHIESGDPAGRGDRLADVFWVLLNAAEFRLNY